MNWTVMKDGQICPTVMPCKTRQEAIDTAVILARYDAAAYAVVQEVYVIKPQGNTVEVRRRENDRLIARETFGEREGTREEA